MAERRAGQRSWPLSPYDLNVTYGKPGDAGLGPDWFGPLEPITPLAPPEVAGRQWDYLSGYNLSTVARGYAPISFATLRGLADGYDLLRLVIETRKDQVARLSWTISARDKKASADPRSAGLKRFFAKPDGRHGFADWLRLLLEDLFVIDAPTLYMRRDRAGRLLGLLPIDGATIKPVIDDWGRTPLPFTQNGATIYPCAYQQMLKGYPAVDYSVRDLLYRPRNIRVDRAYPDYPKIAWDHFEQPQRDDGICWGLKRIGGSGLALGIDVVVLRGSVTQQDWFRDFDALADPFESDERQLETFLHHLGFSIEGAAEEHAFLGPVHPGFLAGMEAALAAMRPLLRENIIIAGHSLGAARAAILTGLMVHDANLNKAPAPLACVTFGQPRPGFAKLAGVIASVPQRSYCNGNGSLVDMITEVPIAFGPENYVHPHPLTDVCEEPGASWKQQWGVFAWHAMPLYLRALERCYGLALSGPDDVALLPAVARHLEIH